MRFNKAAMFGLDGRIALVIFGSLSLITGASIFIALKDTSATAMLTDMRSIGKAWDQYYYDTGKDLTADIHASCFAVPCMYKVEDLVTDPGVAGWKGPYLDYTIEDSYNLDYLVDDDNRIAMRRMTIDEGVASLGCQAGKPCYAVVMVGGEIRQSVLELADEKVDGEIDDNHGNFHWDWSNMSLEPSGWKDSATLVYAPIKNPAD